VLPEHDHDPNYGEACAYLQYVATRNSRFHVTFEHNASLITRQQLLQIYDRTAFMLQEQGGHVLIRP
jgi:hypothetical protein